MALLIVLSVLQRQFNIPNLEGLNRADTLDAFARLAVPKPQRRSKTASPVAAELAPSAMTTTTTTSTPATTKRSNCVTLDVDRMTGECKRIRINGHRNVDDHHQPMEVVVEIVEAIDMRNAGRKRPLPITWP